MSTINITANNLTLSNNVKDYDGQITELNIQFFLLSQTHDICDEFGVSTGKSIPSIVSQTAETILKRHYLPSEPSHDIVQDALKRLSNLISMFHNFVGEDWVRDFESRMMTPIETVMRNNLDKVVETVNSSEATLNSSDLEKLRFLVQMKDFLNSSQTRERQKFVWGPLCKEIDDVLASIAILVKESTHRLDVVTISLEAEGAKDSWSSAESIPQLDEAVWRTRAFLVGVVSSMKLSQSMGLDMNDIVAKVNRFGKILFSFLPSVAFFLKARAEHLSRNGLGSDETIKHTEKEATGLLEVTDILARACSLFHEVAPENFKNTETILDDTRARLLVTIEDTSNSEKRQYFAANRYKIKPEYATEEEKEAIRRKNSFGKRWVDNYEELIKCRDTRGYFHIPPTNKVLVKWAENQRSFYRNSTLTQDKVKLLTKIGFSWDGNVDKFKKHESDWNEMFESLKRYLDLHNGRFPASTEGKLGHWLQAHRHLCRNWINTGVYSLGNLKGNAQFAQARLDKLKSIGAMDWECKPRKKRQKKTKDADS